MPKGEALRSIERLPDRFKGNSVPPTTARFRLRVGRTVRDIVVGRDGCRVERPDGKPDTEICTDSVTWAEIDSGALSGIEAFTQRRLVVRGSIENALRFEPLFDRPAGGGLRYDLDEVRVGSINWSVLSAGDAGAETLLLLHGLGGTKASWLTVVPQLARRYRVLALDFPGSGASSKPRGKYNAPWFGDRVCDLMDELGIDDALIAGNSMGGRVTQEMGMAHADRVRAIACLCPATAFSRRPGLAIVRLLRPELGMLVGRLPRERLRNDLRQLFADPTRIDDAWYEAAIDDFLELWRSPRARLAFFSAARNIYLDEPYGENGFWSRLGSMQTPALYIFGTRDVLISARFGHKIRRVLPSATVRIWSDCGHVPQLEWPDRTADEILAFFSRQKATHARVARIARKQTPKVTASKGEQPGVGEVV